MGHANTHTHTHTIFDHRLPPLAPLLPSPRETCGHFCEGLKICNSAQARMTCSRTPIEKKGARCQKRGPSDCGPVVGLRKEPDRERPKPKNPKAQGPRGPGPDDKTKERHEEASDRRTRRRDGQTSGRTGRRASRHREERKARQRDEQAGGQTGGQAGRQASRQASRQGRQAGRQTGRQASRQAGTHPPTIKPYQFRPSVPGAGSELNPHLGVSRTKNCGNDKQAGRHTRSQASTQSRTSR
jgi:hypothetical protein